MDILYLLVPMSVLAMLAILAVFAWALHAGQFDEVDDEAAQILAASDPADGTGLDPRQGPDGTAAEESTRSPRPRHRSSP